MKSEIHENIAKGRIKEAIDILLKEKDSEFYDDILLLSSRYMLYKSKSNNQLLTLEQENISINTIVRSILSLLNNFEFKEDEEETQDETIERNEEAPTKEQIQINTNRFSSRSPIHDAPINKISWSNCENYISSSSQDGKLRVWNIHENLFEVEHTIKPARSYCTEFSPSKPICVWGTSNGYIYFYDVQKKNMNRIENVYNGRIYSCDWDEKGENLVIAGQGGEIIFWCYDTNRKKKILPNKSDQINEIRWIHGTQLVVYGTEEGLVKVHDIHQDENILIHKIDGIVTALEWNYLYEYLAIGSSSGKVYRWHLFQHSDNIQSFSRHYYPVTSLKFSFDHKIMATKSLDDSIVLWNSRDSKIYGSFDEKSSESWFSGISFSKKTLNLASLTSLDKQIRITEIKRLDTAANNA